MPFFLFFNIDLYKGADINTKDEKSGQTALMAAVLRGKYNIVKYLLEAGADTTIGERMGYTPPHGAAFQGRPDVMRLLIDAGLDVHEYHNDGFAPLHRVCWGREQVSTYKVHAKICIKNSSLKDNQINPTSCNKSFSTL